jgi:hypothetical protein
MAPGDQGDLPVDLPVDLPQALSDRGIVDCGELRTPQFDKTFVGLTGSRDQLEPVWKAYGVSVVRRDLPGSKEPI